MSHFIGGSCCVCGHYFSQTAYSGGGRSGAHSTCFPFPHMYSCLGKLLLALLFYGPSGDNSPLCSLTIHLTPRNWANYCLSMMEQNLPCCSALFYNTFQTSPYYWLWFVFELTSKIYTRQKIRLFSFVLFLRHSLNNA